MIKIIRNIKRVNIEPIINGYVKEKSVIYTDEYNIYDRLERLGYEHKTVCHSKCEYARDEDGDGFCYWVNLYFIYPPKTQYEPSFITSDFLSFNIFPYIYIKHQVTGFFNT